MIEKVFTLGLREFGILMRFLLFVKLIYSIKLIGISDIFMYPPQDLISLRHLSYLAAVADTLSFTKAAKNCFVTQSTLSGGIAELERLLGVTLVDRNRKSVQISAIGKEVLLRARHLLISASELRQFVRHACDPLQGEFILGAIPSIAPYVLPDLMKQMQIKAPKLKLIVRENQTEELINLIESNEIDAGLLALPIRTCRLAFIHLFDDPLYVVGAKKHPLPSTLKHIKSEELLLLSEGHCLREHALNACQLAHGATIEATSISTLLAMVSANYGICLLPKMAVMGGALKDDSLHSKLVKAKRKVVLAHRKSSSRQQMLTLISECLRVSN